MQVPVVRALETRLGGLTTGLYVGGSVATGDYRAGVSDIDVVALMAGTPDRATRRLLAGTHRELVAAEPDGAALHCVYVPSDRAQEPTRRHWTWAFEELFRRPLSGIARAELLADPVIVSGPPPATWLPAMGPDDVRGAAAAELSGYWSGSCASRRYGGRTPTSTMAPPPWPGPTSRSPRGAWPPSARRSAGWPSWGFRPTSSTGSAGAAAANGPR